MALALPRHRELFRHLLNFYVTPLLATYGVLLLLDAIRIWITGDDTRDSYVLWVGANAVWSGIPLYNHFPTLYPDVHPEGYIYPPVFAALLSPLGGLTFREFDRWWSLPVGLAFVCLSARFLQLAGIRFTIVRYLAVIGVFGSYPLFGWSAFRLGQADVLVWFLFASALLSRHPIVWLSIILLMKPYFIWAFLVACLDSTRRDLFIAGGILGAGALIGCVVCGVHSHVEWVNFIAPLSQGSFFRLNISPSMAVLRVLREFGIWYYPGGAMSLGGRAWLASIAFGGPALVAWLSRRKSTQMRIALIGAAGVISSPVFWGYYLPIIYFPIAVWWRETTHRRIATKQLDTSLTRSCESIN